MIPSNSGKGNLRPSHRELSKKIAVAVQCVQQGRWLPASPAKLKANWDELEDKGYVESTVLENEQSDILLTALSEANPRDYAGRRPPERSYEGETQNLELFCFCWESSFCGNREIFLRFSISGNGDEARLWVYSLHPAKRPCKEANP
jgi:hypothetical protein